MTTRARANIFTVPPSRPFLDCLATAILAGDLPAAGGRPPSLMDLPEITLFLPTRRAARALQESFLKAGRGRAMLLPKIMPVSEGEEDLALLSSLAGSGALAAKAGDIPEAMSPLEQRLTLTSLIMRWSEAMRRAEKDPLAIVSANGVSTPAQAAVLAGELVSLMNMIETEGKSLDGLAGLVLDKFSANWQLTIDFLKIVTEYWPTYLAERGLLSAAGRRNAVIHAEARRLATAKPKGPVIVAGVTGSIPATVELMRSVLALPRGAIVLPGLDLTLDGESWKRIAPSPADPIGHPENPQYGLRILLDRLGLARSDVSVLKGAEETPEGARRTHFISEAMRPSGTTARWQAFVAAAHRGEVRPPEGLSLIEAPTAQDEAEAVALILRHVAEEPGRTAALISPDRLLARRVAVRLEAWGIRVDDSAGRPFAKTPPGAFLDLVVNAVDKRFAPRELMALLKHPLTRLGLDPFAVRRAARALEIAAFRTSYLGEGLDGVEAALARARREVASRERRDRAACRLWPADWDGARDLVARLRSAMAPLTAAYGAGNAALASFARAHLAAAEAIARIPAEGEGEPACPLWQGEAGEEGTRLFAELLAKSVLGLEIAPADYAELYRSLVSTINVRPRKLAHPRLFIWGPFEARLQQTDVVVLGSLNDGTWPKSADPGPWLNRPMRQALGLPSPEEAIGQAAHDFATLLAAPTVVMTRAEKVDGVPTVPSRWLLRVKALLEGMGAPRALEPDLPWLGWARQRDGNDRAARVKAPEPRPPLDKRPRRLSVSRIETWIANPYAIFAREILGLERMEPLGAEPGPSLRGSIIHTALSRFAAKYPHRLPEDVEGELVQFAREILDEYAANPRVAAFWVPRFERFASWFAATERARREAVESVIAETEGSLVISAPAGPFTVKARADRIDIMADGLVITDYKTGTLPSDKEVTTHLAPQLPLEAAIAAGLGFHDVPKRPVKALRYIRASGGDPAGEERDVKTDDVALLAQSAVEGLARHVARFDDENTPYRPLRRSRFSYDYDDYAHLARVDEWSSGARNGEEAR